MQHSIIPPAAPGQNDSIRPPMIYIERQAKWEYKQVIRNLEQILDLIEQRVEELQRDEREAIEDRDHVHRRNLELEAALRFYGQASDTALLKDAGRIARRALGGGE